MMTKEIVVKSEKFWLTQNHWLWANYITRSLLSLQGKQEEHQALTENFEDSITINFFFNPSKS